MTISASQRRTKVAIVYVLLYIETETEKLMHSVCSTAVAVLAV